MRVDAIARRYARALFKLAEELHQVDAVAAALGSVADVLDDPDVARVFAGPKGRERKRELLSRLADNAGGPAELRNFLLLVADHDRIDHLGAIRTVFDQLVDQSRGITRARIRTAAPLDDAAVAQLKSVFGQRTGKEVIPQIAVEPELVAGVIVEVDGKVYDGSLRTQLAKLHRQMASGG